MAYTPNIYDPAQPTDAVIAETAQAEFRSIKDAAVFTMNKDLTTVEVQNTASMTQFYSYTVPGGSMATNRNLLYEVIGVLNNTTGVDHTFTLQPKFGGVIIDGLTFTLPQDVDRNPFKLEVEFWNESGSTGNQVFYYELTIFGTQGVSDNKPLLAGFPVAGYVDTIAVDTTVDQDFIMSVQPEVADANLTLTAWTQSITRY